MEPEGPSEMDDLTRWQHESYVKMKEPLQWWRDNRHRFPVLSVACRKSDIAPKTSSLMLYTTKNQQLHLFLLSWF